jgi:hypothetical protein
MADPQSNAAPPAQHLPEGAPTSGVIHVRHRHTDRFTVVGNHLAQHPRLSAVAIGLAVHILSLPDGASVTVKALTLRFREGETTVRRAMNELEAAGYLVRRRVPLSGGRFATRTFAYDRPGSEVGGDQPHEVRPVRPPRGPERRHGPPGPVPIHHPARFLGYRLQARLLSRLRSRTPADYAPSPSTVWISSRWAGVRCGSAHWTVRPSTVIS